MKAKQEKIYNCLYNKGFLPADKESHEIIKNFNSNNLLYELTPCLIVTWSIELNILYRIIDGFLCIANFYPDESFSFYIIRPKEKHNLQHIVDILYSISLEAGLDTLTIWNIEERFLNDYIKLGGYRTETRYDDSFSEYVYSSDSMLNLKGGENAEKRYQLRKFYNKSNIFLEPITKKNVNLCIDIENKWCFTQNCDLCRSFVGCSKKSIEVMIDIFDDDIYQGYFGIIDRKPAGYIIFEKYNNELAYIYFIKTIVSNFSIYLYYYIVENCLKSIKQINNGADLGKKGLQLFKKRLGSHLLLKKYECSFTRETSYE